MDEISGVLQAIDFRGFYKRHIPKFEPNGKAEVQCLCPFHEDENPSLSVNVETGLFNCFGCGEKGNAIQFLQKREGIGFKEALKRVKADCGLRVAEYGLRKERIRIRKTEGQNPSRQTGNCQEAQVSYP